ncbi:MAG: aminotransferase class V-fold PLP-dependent enzyme [Salinibacterium sp.]|nr:aminotransferase class V-fold PLP-dependent enzyme [Salinibacterium sp.]
MTATRTTTGPFFRENILGIEGVVHLYSGAEGPALHAHRDAALRYLDDKSDGARGRQHGEIELAECRAQIARLLNGSADSVALLGNASDALHRLAGSIEYEPGSNVVTSDLEFPSGVQSLLTLRDRGVEVRFARSKHGDLEVADFEKVIDEKTRLVLSSHTSYVSGVRIDAQALRAVANGVGAAFILDATQSLGVLPVHAEEADAIVSSSYKWLLAPHGIGVVHLTRPEAFNGPVSAVGWRSVDNVFAPDRLERFHLRSDARQLELGFPSFPGVYLMNESLRLLQSVDALALEEHVRGLTTQLVDALRATGADLLTPADPMRRGTNVSVVCEDGEAVAERMLERGVRVWGGDGRLRFSIHGFLSSDDIDTAVTAYRNSL